MQLPPPLFRAQLEVESGAVLLPSAFAPGQLAVRPSRAVVAGQLLFGIDAHLGWFPSEAEAQRAGCDLADSLFWRERGRASQRSPNHRGRAWPVLVAPLALPPHGQPMRG